MTARTALIPAVAAALLVAGCGSSSAPKTTAKAAAPAAGGAVAVKLQNISFQPAKITAKVGQTITWTNADNVDHNVTATGGATFKSSDIGNGQSFSTKLTKAGTITYVCTIHKGMDGTIVVTQ
jgi:plastocyanin